MAQAGDGTGHSHWHEGYPISRAASSKPIIRLCDILTLVMHIIFIVPWATFVEYIKAVIDKSADFLRSPLINNQVVCSFELQ